ncbi:hypothetical protein [Cryobacterium sp. Y62]|uniref:hypothetical protein n=1 Tax=Cryobacterium sp. Y62 TaxID=2048284 RepID=UPI000CE39FC4|nr:hypothetical protein [Cryobacterium sp. Y62]
MAKTAILAVKIIADADNAVAGLDRTAKSSKRMADGINKAAPVAAVALLAVAAAAAEVGQAAAIAEQAYGGVDAVFGQYSDSIHKLAASAATDVNLAATDYSTMATILGAQLKNMGVPLDTAVNQTKGLITVGADLAAQFGGPTSDAVSAISSLLRGERDPIERYGISMNQAAVDAQKAAMGLTGLTGEAEKNANLQATLALLTLQSADATGSFGREIDTATSRQENANAEFANAKVALGEQLLPVMTQMAAAGADRALWIANNTELTTVLVVTFAGLAAGILAIAAAMKIYAAVQAIQTVAQWASNAAWLASPITLVVLAIVLAVGLVIAIIVLWVQNWEYLSGVIESGAEAIGAWFASIGEWAANTFGPLIDWIKSAVEWLDRLFSGQSKTATAPTTFSSTVFTADAQTQQAQTMQRTAYTTTATTAETTATLTATPNAGRTGTGSGADSRAGDTYNVTVNGALDPDAVATQIQGILDRRRRRTGSVASAGALR